jgi:hypothetical protein
MTVVLPKVSHVSATMGEMAPGDVVGGVQVPLRHHRPTQLPVDEAID